jgi:hypothetical protein
MDSWYRAQAAAARQALEQEAAQARAAAEAATRVAEEAELALARARAQETVFAVPTVNQAAWPATAAALATAMRKHQRKPLKPLTPAGNATDRMYFYDNGHRCKVGDVVCWDRGYGNGKLYVVLAGNSGDVNNPAIKVEPVASPGSGARYPKVLYVTLVRRRGESFDRRQL